MAVGGQDRHWNGEGPLQVRHLKLQEKQLPATWYWLDRQVRQWLEVGPSQVKQDIWHGLHSLGIGPRT